MRIFVQDQGLRKNIRGHIFDISRLIFFEHNPREIGSAFHPSTIVPTYGAGRAGAETCPPPADWAIRPSMDGH